MSELMKLRRALRLMQSALALVDEAGGAEDVGAHIDLAVQRLEAILLISGEPGAVEGAA